MVHSLLCLFSLHSTQHLQFHLNSSLLFVVCFSSFPCILLFCRRSSCNKILLQYVLPLQQNKVGFSNYTPSPTHYHWRQDRMINFLLLMSSNWVNIACYIRVWLGLSKLIWGDTWCVRLAHWKKILLVKTLVVRDFFLYPDVMLSACFSSPVSIRLNSRIISFH